MSKDTELPALHCVVRINIGGENYRPDHAVANIQVCPDSNHHVFTDIEAAREVHAYYVRTHPKNRYEVTTLIVR